MTTVAGDVLINFASPIADVDPYTNPFITVFDPGLNTKVLSGVNRPTTLPLSSAAFGARRNLYNGSMVPGATVIAKVEFGNAGSGDEIHATLLSILGTGYAGVANQTSWGIKLYDGAAGSPNLSGLIGGTAPGSAAGDQMELWAFPDTPTPGTNTLELWHVLGASPFTRTLVCTTTDATYTGLRPGWGYDAENSSASTIQSWAGVGIAALPSFIPRPNPTIPMVCQ